MNDYEFYELIIFDVHCFPRGRVLSKKYLEKLKKKGIGLYTGVCYFSMKEDPPTSHYLAGRHNYGNSNLIPIMDTLVPSPKSISGDHKVAQIICDQVLPDGSLEMTNPRYVAQRQLKKLEDMGLILKSSFELEFCILDEKYKSWGHDNKMAAMDVIRKEQKLLLDFVKDMESCGVIIDALHPEAGPAQYEMILQLAEGIRAADMTAKFKSMSRTLLEHQGLHATFMTKTMKESFSNGFHYNFSLCNKNGSNAFFDAGQQHQLSRIGQEWLAGLIKHAASIMALCSPTVNCYRRLSQPFTPGKSDWGLHDRFKTFRLVTESDGNIYIESRMPSSACNPYLVMAATVAAGLDGITNHLSLEECDQERPMPKDLRSAMKLLEEDSYIVEALGKETVECFCITKMLEIEHLAEFSDDDDIQMQKERDLYLNKV